MPNKSMLRVNVACYSGFKGEETPLSFIREEKRFQVVEVLERKLEEDFHSKERRRIFRVKTDNGRRYTLLYREKEEEWYLN